MTIKPTSCTHRRRVSPARFSFCWWRHNRLLMTSQWPDNCDAITWIVISNSLDIDFIHGDIHDRSCKKMSYTSLMPDRSEVPYIRIITIIPIYRLVSVFCDHRETFTIHKRCKWYPETQQWTCNVHLLIGTKIHSRLIETGRSMWIPELS